VGPAARSLPTMLGREGPDVIQFVTLNVDGTALVAIPGPNVALIVANSVAHGRRYGLITVAGTSAAMVPQLALTAFGMTGALTLMSYLFEWVRWAGVAYLAWLGVQAWRAPPIDLTRVPAEPRSGRAILARGFLVSLTNPQTLLFYGAFFPQFVAPGANVGVQLGLLSATFLVVVAALDCVWALAAAKLRRALAMHGMLRNRLTGGFYLAAAGGLASARRTS
jgi:homoserine/homoserine lactone efflux protein